MKLRREQDDPASGTSVATLERRPDLESGETTDGYDLLCLSGRGDKDLAEVLEWTGALDGD